MKIDVLIRTLMAFVLCVAVSSSAAFSQKSTTPEKRAQMIQLIAALEQNPYHKDAKAARRAVLEWLTSAPDVTVTICAALLIDVTKLKDDDGAILFGQLPFAEARFILEHLDRASDTHAIHQAGVEGVLRAYAAMKAAKPTLALAPIETLVRIQSDGKLSDFVTEAMSKCK